MTNGPTGKVEKSTKFKTIKIRRSFAKKLSAVNPRDFNFLENQNFPAKICPVKFEKILLKISGETLAKNGSGVSFAALENLATEIAAAQKLKTKIAIVVGGGNFWRGRDFPQFPKNETDSVGMTATLLNGIILRNFFAEKKIAAEIFSAIDFQFARKFDATAAREFLNSGGIPIFVGGTGNPFFTTDSAAILRGRQLSVDLILKATNVDGVFEENPKKNPNTKKFEEI